jgi:hypothetical protein
MCDIGGRIRSGSEVEELAGELAREIVGVGVSKGTLGGSGSSKSGPPKRSLSLLSKGILLLLLK